MKTYYFLISLFFVTLFVSCSDKDDSSSLTMELSKEQAYELVKKNLGDLSLNDVDIYVYPQVLPANSETESFSDVITSPNTESWLFFVDEMPLGNWSHPCRYIFVDASSRVSVVKETMWPTAPSLGEWERINTSDITQNYKPEYVTPE